MTTKQCEDPFSHMPHFYSDRRACPGRTIESMAPTTRPKTPGERLISEVRAARRLRDSTDTAWSEAQRALKKADGARATADREFREAQQRLLDYAGATS
jgi:hypothetical protein